jgi:O-antigen ligase
LFFAPLVLIRKTDDLRHFTLAMLICAILLSIKLLLGINDASLFDPTGHPLTSESREVTQIGAGQAVGFGLLWLLFCPHYSLRRLSLMVSVPLLCAALIASVARGPILFFVAVLVPFLFLRRVRAAVTATNVWLPVLLGGLLAFSASLYWLQRQEAAQGKFATKRAEIEEVLRGSSTPTYTAGRRLTLYRWALQMFAEKPLAGWGLGGWSYYALDRDVPAYPHNLVLEIAAEEGVMGLAALGTLLLTVFLALRRIWRSSPDLSFIAPVFAFSLLATMTSGDINVNRPLWLWCGVIFALAGIAQQRVHDSNTMDWLAFPTNTIGLDRSPIEDYSVYS